MRLSGSFFFDALRLVFLKASESRYKRTRPLLKRVLPKSLLWDFLIILSAKHSIENGRIGARERCHSETTQPTHFRALGSRNRVTAPVALPASRVILRERDDRLAQGIRDACHVATRKAPNGGRVVAVLGLLHVNGVAQRLLDMDQSTASPTN